MGSLLLSLGGNALGTDLKVNSRLLEEEFRLWISSKLLSEIESEMRSLVMRSLNCPSMVMSSRSFNPPIPVPISVRMNTKLRRRRSIVTVPIPMLFLCCASSSSADASDAAFVKETISSHNIVIFSKSYCPYCKTAKAVFKELNQSPHIIELDERDDGYSVQDALSKMVGRHTVPQVFVNGKHIGGADDTVEAYESGDLATLLGIAANGDV